MSKDNVSIQDRDLLGRLSTYFDQIEGRLREGQGWVIFNADRGRTRRISQFIGDRLQENRPFVSSYLVPWRDFALNAYMLKVELVANATSQESVIADPRLQQEYALAGRVSQDMYFQMCYCDLLVLAGLDPNYPHELGYLDQVIDARFNNRRASILITPKMPNELESGFQSLAGRFGNEAWNRFFGRLYDTCLIAM
jgi:hypothetical protein